MYSPPGWEVVGRCCAYWSTMLSGDAQPQGGLASPPRQARLCNLQSDLSNKGKESKSEGFVVALRSDPVKHLCLCLNLSQRDYSV